MSGSRWKAASAKMELDQSGVGWGGSKEWYREKKGVAKDLKYYSNVQWGAEGVVNDHCSIFDGIVVLTKKKGVANARKNYSTLM